MPHNCRPTKIALSLALVALLCSSLFAQDEDWSEFETSVETTAASPEVDSTTVTAKPEKASPFRRRIMREDVTIRTKPLRLDSGGKIRLVYGVPKKAKNVPAVFVLDVESNRMANNSNLRLAGFSKAKIKEFQQASYLLKSPFGSNMLGNGFAVAYIVAEDLETLRSARSADWIGIFNRVRDLKQVDPNNVFLFSTREYANLSVYLTSRYNFSGFILEEPSYLLFSSKTYQSVIDRSNSLSSEEIWSRTDPTREYMYEQVISRISTPIMLIRNPDSKAYALTEKTLIPKLEQANAYYETVEIKGPGRKMTVFGELGDSGVLSVSPEIGYYAPTVSKWVDEIIAYMRINSSVDPIALRDPSEFRSW
ncbi:hypothetical protein [Pelagicoccus mobilis]|uniref:Uncharacterized protein n=1 Tax=Pelagicoccus mobilis TaxID=415221 RepID=A0A934S3F9_9BACT|nr:hypothetical protein [Pelagicoccus mobilis]MBK1879102.1 hypothetical protein [Pelagicoccus mobilis]